MRRSIVIELALTTALASRALAAERPQCDRPTGGAGHAARRRIVVSIPDRKLALVDGGRVVKLYHTAVGSPATPSPSGTHSIVVRVPHPTYYPRGKAAVPPGKANPLGTRWLGLSLKSYGIHGTNNAYSIGRAVSHGCIRMRNEDVEELFEQVEVGDEVELLVERARSHDWIFGSEPSVKPATAGVGGE